MREAAGVDAIVELKASLARPKSDGHLSSKWTQLNSDVMSLQGPEILVVRPRGPACAMEPGVEQRLMLLDRLGDL